MKAIKKLDKNTGIAQKAFTIGMIYAKMQEKPKNGLSPMFYYTGSYEGDMEVWEVLEHYLKEIEKND